MIRKGSGRLDSVHAQRLTAFSLQSIYLVVTIHHYLARDSGYYGFKTPPRCLALTARALNSLDRDDDVG